MRRSEDPECFAGWVVGGRVVDAEGNPVPGAHVQVLDNDLLWDDLVGRMRTDEYGYFEVVYDQKNFAKLVALESKPDLYVIVKDEEGNRLYRTPPTEIRRDADPFEFFTSYSRLTSREAARQASGARLTTLPLIHRSAWKWNSAKFGCRWFSEVQVQHYA